LHLAADLSEAGGEKGLAEALGSPEVRLKDRVTARGEGLRPPVEARLVARRGAAVRQHHERQRLGVAPLGQGQVAGDLQAVRRLIANGLANGDVRFPEPGVFRVEPVRLPSVEINEGEGWPQRLGVYPHDNLPAIVRPGDEGDPVARLGPDDGSPRGGVRRLDEAVLDRVADHCGLADNSAVGRRVERLGAG